MKSVLFVIACERCLKVHQGASMCLVCDLLLCGYFLQMRVRALYDYIAQREDELSFPKTAVITNVQKQDGGW